MVTENHPRHMVCVIGAGPAGLFAARYLATQGVEVTLINRDIKPGGLAEYGIYPSKIKMKEGLRKQFRQILDLPQVQYYGNVTVGQSADVTLAALQAMGFQALLVTAGAQGTKWLGLPGEDLSGVYHAKDLVYHYNQLPPFSDRKYTIGSKVALIGVGNVMMDLAHWLIHEKKVEEAIAVARRGPAEVKFTKKEMEAIARNLDVNDLNAELNRVAPVMKSIGQDPEAAKSFILSGLAKAEETGSDTRFCFEFLSSPSRILGSECGEVCGIEIDDTTLIPGEGGPQAKRTGTKRELDVDTVIFCIGDRVDESFGLPARKNEYVKNHQPLYPVDGISYEAYDPDLEKPIEGIFIAGWSREASSGLVGVARKDGENGAQAVLQFLQTMPPLQNREAVMENLARCLSYLEKPIVRNEHLPILEEAEQSQAQQQGLEDFKFNTNAEMLSVLGLA